MSLAACVITQTMVAVGASCALAGVYAAAGDASPAVTAVGQRGLWLTFLASALPAIVFTVAAVLGLRQARLSPPWVSALGRPGAPSGLYPRPTPPSRGARQRRNRVALAQRNVLTSSLMGHHALGPAGICRPAGYRRRRESQAG